MPNYDSARPCLATATAGTPPRAPTKRAPRLSKSLLGLCFGLGIAFWGLRTEDIGLRRALKNTETSPCPVGRATELPA